MSTTLSEKKKDWVPLAVSIGGLCTAALAVALPLGIGYAKKDASVGTSDPSDTRGIGNALVRSAPHTVSTSRKTTLSVTGSIPYQLSSFYVKFQNLPDENLIRVVITGTRYVITSGQVSLVDVGIVFTDENGTVIPNSVVYKSTPMFEFVENKCPANIRDTVTLGNHTQTYYDAERRKLITEKFSFKFDDKTVPLTVNSSNNLVVRTASTLNANIHESELDEPICTMLNIQSGFGVVPLKYDFNLISSSSVIASLPQGTQDSGLNKIYAFDVEGTVTDYITCASATYLDAGRMRIAWDLIRSAPSVTQA